MADENKPQEAESAEQKPAEVPVEGEKKPEQAGQPAEQPTPAPQEAKSEPESTEKPAEAPAEAEKEEAKPIDDEAALAEQEELARKQAEEEALAAEEIALPDLRPGMTIRIHEKVKEGEKERVQVFQGMVVAMRGKTPETKTVTVQKNSFGVMVDKIYPLASPLIDKIEVVKKAKVRRSKLYYLRDYTKRLKETLVKE
ncbi:MAG: 50S ribosomal protein L19 [Candidatus Kerfeldbacteria bacterium]